MQETWNNAFPKMREYKMREYFQHSSYEEWLKRYTTILNERGYRFDIWSMAEMSQAAREPVEIWFDPNNVE